MAKKIAKVQYKLLLKQQEKLLKDIEKYTQDKQEAASHGDHSENAELDAAKKDLSTARQRLAEIQENLQAEVIEYDFSPIIVEGSLVTVESDEIGELTLLVSDVGNTLDGVLSTSSTLGKAIHGNQSGTYTVNGTTFKVTKIQSPGTDLSIVSDENILEELLHE